MTYKIRMSKEEAEKFIKHQEDAKAASHFPSLSVDEYHQQKHRFNRINMKELKLEAIEDRVLIEVDKAVEQTEAGIYIPVNAQEQPKMGTIVGVGPGVYSNQTGVFCPTTVKVGDRVLFSQYAGAELTYKDETYLVMRQGDIYCTIKD